LFRVNRLANYSLEEIIQAMKEIESAALSRNSKEIALWAMDFQRILRLPATDMSLFYEGEDPEHDIEY
jgi:hypothetical protein